MHTQSQLEMPVKTKSNKPGGMILERAQEREEPSVVRSLILELECKDVARKSETKAPESTKN